MAGFTIPNYSLAVSNGAGDQAEPDSVDFQILGNNACALLYDPALTTGGGAVTGNASANSVTVSAYKVLSNGVPYSKTSSSTVSLDEGGANPRFDLIVIPSNAVTTPTVRKGTEDSTNPVFPALTDGDVVLAAIYRPAGTTTGYPAPAYVIDKRQFVPSNTVWQQTAAPISTDGVNGDLWIDTSATATGQSMLWIKRNGSWENLAEYVALATANTPSTLVQRDASGNFSAGTITANLTGTATNVPWTGVTGRPTVGNVTVGTSSTPPTGSAGDIYIQV